MAVIWKVHGFMVFMNWMYWIREGEEKDLAYAAEIRKSEVKRGYNQEFFMLCNLVFHLLLNIQMEISSKQLGIHGLSSGKRDRSWKQ